MNLKFTKMQGIGNDFVVVDAYTSPVALSAEQIRYIADRHFGVGCDQLLMVERPTQDNVDFRYRIFNADGGEVEQCGNGARCFVRFVHEHQLTDKAEIAVETASGVIYPKLESDGNVTVNMGAPDFNPEHVPFIADAPVLTHVLDVAGQRVDISVVSMGNPHAVQVVPDVDEAPVAAQGPIIEAHPRFPQRVNAGFMQVVSSHEIKLRVYERGSGETLACGTGACAAVVTGIRQGLLESPVKVNTRGGQLQISWSGGSSPVWMTGPAMTVFHGEIELL
jgi:diaminopimelate epimerase